MSGMTATSASRLRTPSIFFCHHFDLHNLCHSAACKIILSTMIMSSYVITLSEDDLAHSAQEEFISLKVVGRIPY